MSEAGRRRGARVEIVAIAAALAVSLWAGATLAGVAPHIVSQRGREFTPGEITIKRGESLEIVNDDGDLIHHAYIDADGFSFDSGDQEPGSKVTIPFTKAGMFTVLCGIHPKMKMAVTVQD